MHCNIQSITEYAVASYVGAWIETAAKGQSLYKLDVASYVGAWIETMIDINPQINSKSHPMWVRGLKHCIDYVASPIKSRILCGCVD